jgi:hypothetical protein
VFGWVGWGGVGWIAWWGVASGQEHPPQPEHPSTGEGRAQGPEHPPKLAAPAPSRANAALAAVEVPPAAKLAAREDCALCAFTPAAARVRGSVRGTMRRWAAMCLGTKRGGGWRAECMMGGEGGGMMQGAEAGGMRRGGQGGLRPVAVHARRWQWLAGTLIGHQGVPPGRSRRDGTDRRRALARRRWGAHPQQRRAWRKR